MGARFHATPIIPRVAGREGEWAVDNNFGLHGDLRFNFENVSNLGWRRPLSHFHMNLSRKRISVLHMSHAMRFSRNKRAGRIDIVTTT